MVSKLTPRKAWSSDLVLLSLLAIVLTGPTSLASQLVEVRIVDNEHLMIYLLDGEIHYKDDGQGKHAFMGHEHNDGDLAVRFDPPLDVQQAMDAANWPIHSADDSQYSHPLRPTDVYRKTKVNGTTWQWPEPEPEPEYTVEHEVFLRLPHPMLDGAE